MENFKIPYSKQEIDNEDIEEIKKVMSSQFLTTGPKIEEFEEAVREKTQIIYNVACNSGTAALHMALLAIGAGPGDEVILPSISFVATGNAIEYVGATPVFADIDPDTLLIDIDDVKKKITKRTIAVIAVDLGGKKPDYEKLRQNVGVSFIISDAAHNIGGHDQESIKNIDLICYSFHPVKHITTGEGGMVSTNNFMFFNRLKCMRNHGRSNGDMMILGFNYRMTDIQAALGISQLNKLNQFITKRIEIANKYLKVDKIKNCAVESNGFNTYHLFQILVQNRGQVQKYLYENGITTQVHYKPIYSHSYYLKKYSYNFDVFENTEKIRNKILSIPIYPGLKDNEQEYIIEKLLHVI